MQFLPLKFAAGIAGVTLCFLGACSSNDDSPQVPVADSGAYVSVPTDAGKRETAVAVPTASNPTPRCTTAKKPSGVYEVGDAGVSADGSAPSDAGEVTTVDGGPVLTTAIRAPRVVSYGGPVLSQPRWQPIFFQDPENQLDLEDFLGSIGCTDYWDTIGSDYGVGGGVSAPTANIAEAAPAKIDDNAIKKWLLTKIKAGAVEAPTANTVYVIFYPSSTEITLSGSTSCLDFGGYHGEIAVGSGQYAAYAVIPSCGNFDQLTSTITHELIEASTDPYPNFNPAYSFPDDRDVAWAFAAGGEVGDLCTFIQGSTINFGNYPYAVQRSFSNKASLTGHDPCVPTTSTYFYAAPSLEMSVQAKDLGNFVTSGISVPPGTTKTVAVTIGADGTNVNAVNVSALSGKKLQLSQGNAAVTSVYTLDRDTAAVGDTLYLTIGAPANASESEVFALSASALGRRNYWYALVTH